MHDSSPEWDELDRSILHALQISPRAPWAAIGRVLGVDAATIGRRWERLRASGSAWTTCYPGLLAGSICIAFIEIDVQSGQQVSVGRTLATYPHVITVEHMAGGRDLLITVMIPDLGALSELVSERISPLPGVVRTRAALATRVFTEGSRWRLRSLTPAQQRQLAQPTADQPAPPDLDEQNRQLITALSRNARTSAVELSEQVGLSTPNVRRRVASMVHNGDASLRCEIARPLTEWPISASLWASVPPGQLDKVVQGLSTLPELRLCASVTGPQNLLFTVWLRSIAEVGRLESLLGEKLPQLQLADRAVALRQVKLMGRLVDEHGYATTSIPIDPWLPPKSLPPTAKPRSSRRSRAQRR